MTEKQLKVYDFILEQAKEKGVRTLHLESTDLKLDIEFFQQVQEQKEKAIKRGDDY